MAADSRLVAGRYRLGRRLAAGGLSRVWLATDEERDATVAIKRCALPEGLSADEGEIVREVSVREARAFARVEHPNVVGIRDVVHVDGELWIVMDYIASRSLHEVVTAAGPMHPRRVAEIGLQVLRGLAGVFDAGVLHLDVKPGNVLLAEDGRVLLSDFGPAVTEAGVRALSDAGMIFGSLNYVAPERLFDGISTRRSDLWSFGATLYFAVEGRAPFRRDTPDETTEALRGGTPDPLLRAGPLGEVIGALMRAEPGERLTAAAADRALRRVAGSAPEPVEEPVEESVREPVPAPPAAAASTGPASIRPRPDVVVRGPRRVRRPVAVAAAVVAAAVAALGITAATRHSGEAVAEATPRPVPAVSSPSAAPEFRLPPGYAWHTSRDGGFRVATPARWTVRETGGVFSALAPGGGVALRVRAGPAGDPVAGLIALESDTRLDGYRRVRIEPVTDPPGTVWEYTYRSASGRVLRAAEQVVPAGARSYRIGWLCPREAWTAELATWSTVLASFGPLTGA